MREDYLQCANAELLVSVVPAITNQPHDKPVQDSHSRAVYKAADRRCAFHSIGAVYDCLRWCGRNKVKEGPERLTIIELVLQTVQANPTLYQRSV